ncbi:MAG TPA: protein kinase [Nocardioides sp.]|nr:protein kinase [Nocardioides sp.]
MHPGSESPTRVGDYTLLSRLGEGGMGIVHLAQGPDGRRVALKVLRPHIVGDEEARARLAREVSSLRRVRSPWVAEMVAADPWAEIPYVVTRYVAGPSLHDRVQQEGPVSGTDLAWLAGCLAEGLSAVHAVGVLHRDVKPGNVLLEGRTPILIDFGLARVADDPRLTHTGWLLGTPGYLAPEILYGDEPTPAADVHAWAATVAFAASGRPPYGRGPSMAVMDRTRRGQHDLGGIDRPLRGVLEAALDPDPLERPLLEELLGWLRPLSTRPDLPEVSPPGAVFTTAPLGQPAVRAPSEVPTAPVTQGIATIEEPPLRSVPAQGPEPAAVERMEQEWDARWDPEDPFAPRPKAPLAERLRRLVGRGLGAVALGTAFAAAPWVSALVVVLAVWLLRAGSLAASAVAERRTLRGAKWHDPLLWAFTSPWHLVRAVTGTVVLVLWSGGLGIAAALLCYALAVDLSSSLLVGGAVLTVALWTGPGGSRFRSPVSRALNPWCRRSGPWLFLCAALLAISVALGVLGVAHGVSWVPWDSGPFGV